MFRSIKLDEFLACWQFQLNENKCLQTYYAKAKLSCVKSARTSNYDGGVGIGIGFDVGVGVDIGSGCFSRKLVRKQNKKKFNKNFLGWCLTAFDRSE